jgi:hypothetical protein
MEIHCCNMGHFSGFPLGSSFLCVAEWKETLILHTICSVISPLIKNLENLFKSKDLKTSTRVQGITDMASHFTLVLSFSFAHYLQVPTHYNFTSNDVFRVQTTSLKASHLKISHN